MKLEPQASVEISYGGGQKAKIDWSLSPTGAGDTPRQIEIHRAVSAGVDFVKARMQPQLDEIEDILWREHVT